MKKCFNCNAKESQIYEYIICDSCKSKLRLFTNNTIQKYNLKDPKKFALKVKERLDFLDKDYIKKELNYFMFKRD